MSVHLGTGSIIGITLAHGAINTCVVVFASITVAVAFPDLLEYWAGESGVLSLIGITLLAGWLLYRLQRQPDARQTAATPARQPLA